VWQIALEVDPLKRAAEQANREPMAPEMPIWSQQPTGDTANQALE
jgi:hypothetical protein